MRSRADTLEGWYRTIVADPPWPYTERVTGNPANPEYTGGKLAVGELPYPTLTIAEICDLPVAQLAEPDAHLYLWTTQRFLRDSFTVLDSWDFRLAAVLVWAKPPKGHVGTFVSSTEFVLFGRRGHLAAKRKHIGSFFQWSRRAHSEKPEAFLDLVEMISPGPYLEMFARRQRLGWDTWGDEALEHVSLAAVGEE